ncbi:hypothetical protein COT75_04215 [Candidatus Beckwithbacteria bacterium CG10_big_fil_rev_8_21_14_0_10_34_10]|uniref:Uncharacterized protein n=1 Tax=Candidatus Beckwithbacteria bacterium CG10_big_fil_rev_8_21_14_0_10_34_10 TaxID=1974495 RepID=A0A2H0W8E7_9BACT|nr:MAG: hypothetical protein COT75_04215 [Candidatus Beckwithbacteria bacterium CG10_big_fil_rev_8_21_14_0_10_34_10]
MEDFKPSFSTNLSNQMKPENLKKTFKPLMKNENKIYNWILAGLSLLIPFFFIPLTADFYGFNKTVLLIAVVIILLFIWGINSFFNQKIKFLKAPLNLPILSLLGSYLLATIIQSPNKVLTLSGETGLIITLTLLYFIIVNHLKGKNAVRLVLDGLLVSSLGLGTISLLSYLKFFSLVGPQWLNSKAWTPTGSPLSTGLFMLSLLPATVYWAYKSKKLSRKIFLFGAASMQTLAIGLVIALFIDKTISLNYLNPRFGWVIAVEGFKTFRTAFFGVGPGNFISAFTHFRPIGLNSTNLWAIRFGSNSNQYFNLISTVGLLGLASYIWIVWSSLKGENFKGSLINKFLYIALLTTFLSQLVFAAGFLSLFLTFLLIGLLQASKMPAETQLGYEHQIKSQTLIWGISGLVFLLSIFSLYWYGRLWMGDFYFRKSLLAAQENRGGETYNYQIKAINYNRFSENYRVSYSNTNLALANSLASQENLSDQDRNNISQLISQSIREAKAASTLNSQISDYWLNQAIIYRNVIYIAQGAGDWSVAAYLEAIRNDPTNPMLRLELGSLFYAVKDYDRAIQQFLQAANLKTDYANAYYNLAASYREKEDWTNAFSNMQAALSLVPIDSPDYQKAAQELEEIRQNLPEAPTAQATGENIPKEEQLKEPEPLPTPKPNEKKVELPADSKPNLPELTDEQLDEATKSAQEE